MGGLIEQADGGKRRPEHTPDTARHAWQESMLRPIDELGQALRRLEPMGIALRAGCAFDGHALLLDCWPQSNCLAWPELAPERLADGQPCPTFDQAMPLYYLNSA